MPIKSTAGTSRRRRDKLPLEASTQKKIATFMANKGYEVRREVKTPVGKIDLLVTVHKDANVVPSKQSVDEVSIIECKRHHDVNSLKSAIGQLRAYANYYPSAKLILCTEEKIPLSNPSKILLNNNKDIRLVVL